MMRAAVATAVLVASAPTLAVADDASVTKQGDAPKPDPLDVRLTLSSFLYQQSGGDPGPLVDQGASPQNASPVRRFFGDLRFELGDGALAVDARVRQTTSERYQAGAAGGGEYELRTLSYKLGPATTNFVVGRQYIDAVGATKIDGVAFHQQLVPALTATVFAGAFPQLGSRSVDTDYVHARNPDGSDGDLILPVAGGLGVAYQTLDYHGDVGLAAVYVPTEVPGAPADEKSRVFTTASGYVRPSPRFDAYHFALLDVAGGSGVQLVNGSLGVDARPVDNLQLTLAVNHVSTDLMQIVARNFLTDPDPSAIGVVQNNIVLLRISQDSARAGASVALAQQRFEISASAGLRRRPEVSVTLADGSGAVVFPEAESSELTMTVLDRRSIAGLRAALSATLTEPIGNAVPNRSRGTAVRAVASRMFADQRGQVEADVGYEHFRDAGAPASCTGSLAPLACFGTSTTNGAQTGALVSWRVGREWMVVADAHVGYQKFQSTFMQPVTWPALFSVTAFARVQWRYR